jgi:TonB-linked SusC/RagA family outer membrane protein
MYKKNTAYTCRGLHGSLYKMVFIMKLTFILLTVCFFQVSAATYAQRVTLKVEKVSIKEVFEKIQAQTNYDFLYNTEDLLLVKPVSLDLKNVNLKQLLDICFSNQPLTYTIENTTILISKKVLIEPRKSADIIVTGKVTDEKNKPLPGVGIKVKDGQVATVSDANGNYKIVVSDPKSILVFSYIGFAIKEVPASTNIINIVLISQDTGLSEVVVVGYGTTKRKDFTGSVSSLNLEDSPIAQLPNMNALKAIKGNLPGLDVGPTTRAGGQPSIQIRGENSISGDNSPLIVLDGVIYLGNIADINPNDIASFDVLKDATSAAAYGSRSANGVIAITTKRGRTGKPTISLNSSTGFQTWQNSPEMMKGAEWISVVNARNNFTPGSTNWMKPGEIANLNAGKETNWLDEVTRTGIVQSNQAAVSGASENVNYYLSTSYDNEKGIIVGDKFDRISLLGKIKTDITSWLSIGIDGSYAKRNYPGFQANVAEAQRMSPYGVMFRDDQGNLEKYPYTQSGINPLWGVNDGTRESINKQNSYRLNANAKVSVPWVDGLSYQVNFMNNSTKNESGSFTHDRFFIQEGAFDDLTRYSPAKIQGFLTNANGNLNRNSTRNYVLDHIVNYKQKIEKHEFDITLVATWDKQRYEMINSSGANFTANGNTTLGLWGLHKATVQKVDLDVNERANIGYLGRLNYTFDDKYYFTGSFRRDGASVFGANKKWANFFAAGFAWKISNEQFLKNFEQLNSLKLKFSYGQNGSQGVGPYGTLSIVANGTSGGARYEFSNAPAIINYGLYQSFLGNDDLGWENTASWNTGFESSWLNNRLSLDLDIYYSKTTDQIFTRNIPVMTGFKTVKTSLGQVNNSGIEATLRTVNISKKDLSWSSSLIFWKNNNKLVSLYGPNKDGKEEDDLANNLFIGHSLGSIYGYVQDGIVQTSDIEYMKLTGAAAGSPKYKDIDGIPGISATDRRVLGSGRENFRMSLGNTFTYKSFDFYLLVTGTFGGNNTFLRSNPAAYMSSLGTGRFNDNMSSKPYWTVENPSNVYTAANFAGDGRFLGLQSRSFIRVQDATVSYRLKKEWLDKVHVKSLKVFLSAQNLAVITNWVGGDPETGTIVGENIFPVPSTYAIGANINF